MTSTPKHIWNTLFNDGDNRKIIYHQENKIVMVGKHQNFWLKRATKKMKEYDLFLNFVEIKAKKYTRYNTWSYCLS